MTETAQDGYDLAAAREDLYTHDITACRGAFSAEWLARLREDVDAAFEEARSREGGAVGRGPLRWYVEVHPQAFAPIEIAPGTQWDPGEDFDHAMFAPKERYPDFEGLVTGEE